MTNQNGGAARVEKLISTFGCLPTIGETTTVEHFRPEELAAGIETEINRAHGYGFTKITLHMDLPDAAALAKHLRKRVR